MFAAAGCVNKIEMQGDRHAERQDRRNRPRGGGRLCKCRDASGRLDELQSSGFDRAELSLLADERTVDQKLHRHYRKVTELEDDAEVPRAAYVSPESVGAAEGALIGILLYVGMVTAGGMIVVSGGTLAAALAGAAIAGGVGGMLGTMLATLVGDRYARYIEEQLNHGGLLLWVRTWNPGDESRAVEILKRHSGRDVHIHGIA
jgi:hypothetical protein